LAFDPACTQRARPGRVLPASCRPTGYRAHNAARAL
jgi:hypothetical protein